MGGSGSAERGTCIIKTLCGVSFIKRYTVISLGAGVQSSTMLLMAARGEITPKPDVAIFADTGSEPKVVYKWLDWLEKEVAGRIPILRVSRGNLGQDILDYVSGRSKRAISIPFFARGENGRAVLFGRRLCTSDYKIKVIIKAIREHVLGLRPGQRVPAGVEVEQWLGISLDEITRMKPAREKWIRNRWPLIEKEMTRDDCVQWMKRHGYPEPPKSSCVFCPYHSDAVWLWLKREHPDDWQYAVELDRAVRHYPRARGEVYLHRSLRPLDQVEFNEETNDQLVFDFSNECEGMCGV